MTHRPTTTRQLDPAPPGAGPARSRGRRRGPAALAVALALALVAAACSSGGESGGGTTDPTGGGGTGATVAPVQGGTFTEATPRDLLSFSAIKNALVSVEAIIVPQVFPGLLTQDADGNLQPDLADLPTANADNTQFTFTLQDGVRWSDGTPLTAADVAFTYQVMYDPAWAAVTSNPRSGLEAALASVEARDDRTVVFTTKGPNVSFPALHGRYPVYPEHVLGDVAPADMDAHPFFEQPTVASGPFKFLEWQKGNYVALERNPDYFGQVPNLERYVLKTLSQPTAVVNQLKTGEIQAARVYAAGTISELEGQPGLTVQTITTPNLLRFLYQLDPAKPASAMFSDPAVREALIVGLDRPGIRRAVYFDIGATVQDQAWTPASLGYEPGVDAFPYDPDRARQLLDQAGWVVGGDGIREKDGVRLQFQVTVPSTAPDYQAVAQVMQENWRQLGVDASPEVVGYAEWNASMFTERNFDVIIYGLSNRLDPDTSNIWSAPAAAPGGNNSMPYLNDEVDDLLAQALATAVDQERQDLYFQVQDHLVADVPSPILFSMNAWWVYSDRLHNLGEDGTMGTWTFELARPMSDVFLSDS